jgi:large subunit ribosomal protein L6
MKRHITKSVVIPEGITCSYKDFIFTCTKDSDEIKREIKIPQVELKISEGKVTLDCKKGNRNQNKIIMTFKAHILNLFEGLKEKFTYKLEAVNVHFPLSIKIIGDKVVINNFFGEKVPRYAKIMPNVEVDIKGQNITVSSINKEAAGQTAANLEKATKVKEKDKRIYQDGIYIVEKPSRRSSLTDMSRRVTEKVEQEQGKRGVGEKHNV